MKKLFLGLTLATSVICLASCSIKSTFGGEDSNGLDEDLETTEVISTYTEAYAKVMNSCFGVKNIISDTSYAIGSCVCIKKDDNYSYFITNRHVIESADNTKESSKLSIYFGEGTYYKATLLACTTYSQRSQNSADDLALLRIATPNGETIKAVEFSTSLISKGCSVISVGCPLSLSNYNTLTAGIVSKVITSSDLYMHTATINPGNSGGGLFTLDGKLVGLNVSANYSLETSGGYTYNEVDDQYNAITYSHILSFLDDNNFELD